MEKKKITIAVMMRDVYTEISEAMYSGFCDEAYKSGINLVLLLGPQSTGEDMQFEDDGIDREYVDQLDGVYDFVNILKPDALIIADSSLKRSMVLPDINALVERYRDIPMLVLDTIPGKPSISYQVTDSYQAMCECVEHLIVEHRYNFIVYISGDTKEYEYRERLKAFKDTMRAHSLNYDNDQIIICRQGDSEERKISAIFDDFPYVNAIVCSSDEYARIVYRVCYRRSIAVGRDVAVTGFDGVGRSHEMNPELTGVMYDGYDYGREAVKRTIGIVSGRETGGKRFACRFVKRASCGCMMGLRPERHIGGPAPFDEQIKKKLRDYLDVASAKAINDIFTYQPFETERKKFEQKYQEMLVCIYKALLTDWDELKDEYVGINGLINELMEFEDVSARMITDKTVDILENMMYMLPHGKERAKLTDMMLKMFKGLKEAEIRRMRYTGNRRKEQLWFIPLFTKDLLDTNMTENDAMATMFRRLRGMNVRSAHIFLYDSPVIYREGQLPPVPKKLHYAGHFDESELHVYLKNNSINIDKDNGITSVLPHYDPHSYSSFVICSGNRQYGIILYEIEKQDVFFAMMCTLQIGAFFHFRDINYIADGAREKVRELSDVINYVSDKDDLTGLLNGTGFVQRFDQLMQGNSGRKGYLLFADVSHINEINRRYGYPNGDKALIKASEIFRNILGEEAIPARIGDDEFISVILSDKYDMIDSIKKKVRSRLEEYNSGSADKFPVTVEMASYPITVGTETDIHKLLKEAAASIVGELKAKGGLELK